MFNQKIYMGIFSRGVKFIIIVGYIKLVSEVPNFR